MRQFTTLVDSRFAPGADRGWFGRAANSAPWSARMRVEFIGAPARLMEWVPRSGVVRTFAPGGNAVVHIVDADRSTHILRVALP